VNTQIYPGDNSYPPPPPDDEKKGLWNRIGILGQVLTALLGVTAAVVSVLIATGLQRDPPPTPLPIPAPSTQRTSETPTTPPVEDINLTISDQLTDGAEEETVVVVLEGARVATLHATSDSPVVSERVTATTSGNYDYQLDAVIKWYDDAGELQETQASGHGSVYIDDGMRLDVYVHFDGDSVGLSLQSATES
jgi:hypothetical protein